MEIQEIIKSIEKIYRESVKPYLNDSQMMTGMEMGNLNIGIIHEEYIKIIKYHSGLLFIGSAKRLEDKLKKEECTEHNVRMFEAYFAQLSLSVKSGNTF